MGGFNYSSLIQNKMYTRLDEDGLPQHTGLGMEGGNSSKLCIHRSITCAFQSRQKQADWLVVKGM